MISVPISFPGQLVKILLEISSGSMCHLFSFNPVFISPHNDFRNVFSFQSQGNSFFLAEIALAVK